MTEIKNRWTGATIASGELIKDAAESSKADLRRANLSGAYLSRADLIGANLNGADLRRANLIGTNLSKADLSGADLRRANLIGAYLSGTNLSKANLIGAYLSDADLSGANLSETKIPVLPSIDHAIFQAISTVGNSLEMDVFHSCETTHCRAGWAVHLAGKAGYELEKRLGACAAGALIYAVSRPNMPVPDFYASNEDALADIEKCALAIK
jgi:hypothetical protein